MYLLDTHALVWAVSKPEELPARVRKVLNAGEIMVSVVSYWELVLKKAKANAPVLQPAPWWEQNITRAGVSVLPVRVAHIDQVDTLPDWHHDPFDRMLIAQAIAENCTLVSRDVMLGRYGVALLWK